MEIRTARLLLRRPRLDDLDAFFEMRADPRAMRYWSTLPHASIDVTRAWLEQVIARSAAGGEDFAIEMDGRVIGEVGAGRLPEFGFMIHPEFWGRGLASEAAEACIASIFERRDTPNLMADVDPRNTGSLRVLSKLGFVKTGEAKRTFLLGDEWCDSVYLTLDRPTPRI